MATHRNPLARALAVMLVTSLAVSACRQPDPPSANVEAFACSNVRLDGFSATAASETQAYSAKPPLPKP